MNTSSVEADTTFIVSAFQVFTKRTAKINAQSDAIVCALKSSRDDLLHFLVVRVKNLSAVRLISPLVILKMIMTLPRSQEQFMFFPIIRHMTVDVNQEKA